MSEPEDEPELGDVEREVATTDLGLSAEMQERVEAIQEALRVMGTDLVAAKAQLARQPQLAGGMSVDIDLALEGLDRVGKGLVVAWAVLDHDDDDDESGNTI